MIEMPPQVQATLAAQPYPLLFATLSGAHLYGFPSADSDYDLRGAHILPLRQVLRLQAGRETVEVGRSVDGVELDLVTHDIKPFFALLLKRNGNPLEAIYSPLVLRTGPAHEELKAIAARCITRHHGHHYLGFAATKWAQFEREQPRRVKPLLYVYRVLLTGIHLLRTGEVEASLPRLNETFRLPYIPELVARKLAGPEAATLDDADLPIHRAEYERLIATLEQAQAECTLPELPQGRDALDDLLVRLRLAT